MDTPITKALPSTGYLRLKQIVGDKNNSIPGLIPVSASTWWAGVASGRFPKPYKISARVTAWRVEEIVELIEAIARAKP